MFKPETDLIEPLDYLILNELPVVGTTVFDLYPDGRSSKDVAEGVLRGALNVGQTGRRLASLNKWGLVQKVSTPGRSAGTSYQATVAGKEVYNAWKKRQGEKEVSDGGE